MSEGRDRPYSLTDFSGVDDELATQLRDAGFETVEHVAAATPDQLRRVDGLGMALAGRISVEAEDVEVRPEIREEVAAIPDADSAPEKETVETETEPDLEALTDLAGVDETIADRLRAAGFESVEHVAAASAGQLRTVDGISRGFAARLDAETRLIEVGDEIREEVAAIGSGDEDQLGEDG